MRMRQHEVRLDEVADVGAGNPAPQGKAPFDGGVFPFFRTSDVGKIHFGEISTSVDLLNDFGASRLRLVPRGTILMPKSGASTFLNHRAITGVDGYVSSHLATITPKDGIANARYLLYALSRVRTQDLLSQNSYPSLNLSLIKDITVPLPPMDEQRRIVAVLDEAFEGLNHAHTNAHANLQDARELFETYLTDVFAHPDLSWNTAQLSTYCEEITVGHVGPMANRYVASGTPFLRSQNIRPFSIDLTDVKFVDDAFVSELKKSELRPGDVAIVRTGYPGTCAVIPDDLEVANCADLVIARTGAKLNPHFLALFLNSSYGKKLVAGVAVGAAQKHFNVGAAKRTIFPCPPLETQDRLVEQANDLRTATLNLEVIASGKSKNISNLRQSLLQRAFAGELK